MPQKTIYIEDSKGRTLSSVTGPSVCLKSGTLRVTESAQGAELSVRASADKLSEAYSLLTASPPYISMVNGARPAHGGIWLHTDACTSWTPGNNGLVITDTCPACETCDRQLQLKRRFEQLKMMVNDMKDASLYPAAVRQARMAYLESGRIPSVTGCSAGTQEAFTPAGQYELLKNYMTAVHMWNYAVSRRNSETVITSAPESASGFCVQTRRAVPSCGGNASVQCTVEISGRSVQTGISVLYAAGTTEFKPFSEGAVGAGQLSCAHDPADALHKTVTTSFNAVDVAGTYFVTVKFIPFRCVTINRIEYVSEGGQVVEKRTPVDLNTIDWTVLEVPKASGSTGGDTTLRLGDCTVETVVKTAPVYEDYRSSLTYPSTAVDGMNVWNIYVTWTVTLNLKDAVPLVKTYTDSYIFETARAGEPLNGLLRDSDWVKFTDIE